MKTNDGKDDKGKEEGRGCQEEAAAAGDVMGQSEIYAQECLMPWELSVALSQIFPFKLKVERISSASGWKNSRMLFSKVFLT